MFTVAGLFPLKPVMLMPCHMLRGLLLLLKCSSTLFLYCRLAALMDLLSLAFTETHTHTHTHTHTLARWETAKFFSSCVSNLSCQGYFILLKHHVKLLFLFYTDDA